MDRPVEHALFRRTLLAGTAAAGAGVVWGGMGKAVAGGWTGPVKQVAVAAEAALLDRVLIQLRRDIHRHPEAPGQEQRTAALVARELRAAGLDVTTGVGGHGVVGVLRGSRPGRTVAYRADMDAVPPKDIVGGGPAPAHVCGHDIHTTVSIGVARVLARLRRQLSGTVVFLFQPAVYLWLARQQRVVDAFLANDVPASERTDLRFHLAMLSAANLLGSMVHSPQQLRHLSEQETHSDQSSLTDLLYLLLRERNGYSETTGSSFDKIAKGPHFVPVLLRSDLTRWPL